MTAPASRSADLPVWWVPRLAGAPRGGSPLADLPWSALPALPPLRRSEDGGVALQQTAVRLAWDEAALYVRFDCADRGAWGTYFRRDDPIYLEEVVEVFLAPDPPGAEAPRSYLEIEVSPRGTLFDARVENPDGRRDTMRVDAGWDCEGLRWEVGATGVADDWWAALALPWKALAPEPRPGVWRANFYRIERPRDGSAPEFSAWSPTLVSPPDFHRPERFGRLILAGG